MAEGLFDSRELFRRALLPFPAFGRCLGDAAEFPAVGNPVGFDLESMALMDPLLDLPVGGRSRQHYPVAAMVALSGSGLQSQSSISALF